MRKNHDEVSPLFMIGRDSSAIRYDELDAYDDNWDLRDVPLEKHDSDPVCHLDGVSAETEMTCQTTHQRRGRGSLHHDEEEAVLCPLVFAASSEDDEDDVSSGSQSSLSSSYFRRGGESPRRRRTSHALRGWRLRRRGQSQRRLTIGIGVLVLVAATLAFLAYFPTISEHAVSFKASLNERSRQLTDGTGTSDEENFRITFPATPSPLNKAVSTALEALF